MPMHRTIVQTPLLGLLGLLCLLSLTVACSDADLGAAGPGEAGPGAAGGGRPSRPPVVTLVATAELRAVQSEISTVGSLRSPETTTVAADVSGIIVSLNAPAGRRIGVGHEIARLDDAATLAALQVAEARQRNAHSALERARPLVRDGVVPQQTLDDAEAEMATAEGLLEEARTRQGKTRVLAPFGGLVGIQTAQLGQYVSSGDAIIQLTQLDPLELVFGVPEEQASSVRVGQSIKARVGRCGVEFEGVVQALDPQIDSQARTLAVQARVSNPKRELIPGMSARVRLTVGEAFEEVVIPREAMVATNKGYMVWTVSAENAVSPQPVTAGRFFPDVVQILDGLAAGDRVVAAGHQKLSPGATVAPEDWIPTNNPDLDLGTRGVDDCVAVR